MTIERHSATSSTVTSYTDGLDFFYAHSDEDETDAAAIYEWLTAKGVGWAGGDAPACWLDVGSGPLGKIARILGRWQRERGGPLPRLVLIEPLAEWGAALAANLRQHNLEGLDIRTIPRPWEECVRGGEPLGRFRVVSFLHSLYGIGIDPGDVLSSLGAIPGCLEAGGWACFAIESPDSDLLSIKRALFPQLGLPLVDYRVLERTFAHFGWHFSVQGDILQRLYLAGPESLRAEALERSDRLAFLFQTRPEWGPALAPPVSQLLRREVAERLQQDTRGWYVHVPDRIYWMQAAP